MPHLLLKRPHTHAGQAFEVGERIDVEASTADWLIAHGVAAPVAEPSKPEATSKPLHRKESQS